MSSNSVIETNYRIVPKKTYKFESSFGKLITVPKNSSLENAYLPKCKYGQTKSINKKHKKKKISGFLLIGNSRIFIKKSNSNNKIKLCHN